MGETNIGPETFVNDNVQLVKRLAGGAMGEVWLANHRTLRIQVAVKLMATKLTVGDQVAADRFAEEASTAARIKSPTSSRPTTAG